MLRCSQKCTNASRRALTAEEKQAAVARTAAWREANPERLSAQRAAELDRAKKKRAAVPPQPCTGAQKEAARIHYRLNADAYKQRSRDRKARLRGTVGKVPLGLRRELMKKQRGKCAACRADLESGRTHMDHIMPLALGGEHAANNLQLLCVTCNCSKSAKHPVDFMRRMGFLC